MKVLKFGGTSMASAKQMKKCIELIKMDPKRRVVVVSAPGKRDKEDQKVTDLLILCAERLAKGQDVQPHIDDVLVRYTGIAEGLGVEGAVCDEILEDLQKRAGETYHSDQARLAAFKAAGEDHAARLFAAALRASDVPARYISPKEAGLILTGDGDFCKADPSCYKQLKNLLDIPEVIVFPGFFGYSKEGELMTFSRGGSDITGAVLAAALEAEVYENFTDVDGVYSANMKYVESPSLIPRLSYREMRELSYAGFNVLHDEALEPIYRKGIPVNIRNTNNLQSEGTLILPHRHPNGPPVVGVAGDSGFCALYVSKYMMNREVGFGRRLLQIIEDENVPYEHTPSGIDNITVILHTQSVKGKMERIVRRIEDELHADSVTFTENIAVIMVVGEGIAYTPGIVATAAGALYDAKVSLNMVSQSSSGISIMFGVFEGELKRAISALYRAFF